MSGVVGGIPALWFDRKGCGPDEFALELQPIKADLDGRIPASLGIRVRAGDLVINGALLIDGGFMLGREQVAELHRQLGDWLQANPVPAGTTEGAEQRTSTTPAERAP